MRFNEAVCNSMPPMHFALHNNNQLQRSSSELIINEKVDYLTGNSENQEFHIGQDTSTYSSFAITHNNNKNIEHNINNNLDNTYQSSSIESLADFEDCYEDGDDPEDVTGSDWSEYSEDGNLPAGCRGIVNPNYPGFQHLGPSLLSDTDDTDDEPELQDEIVVPEDIFNNNSNNNNNNIIDETVNRFDAQRDEQKQLIYEKPKFKLQSVSELIECMNLVKGVHSSPVASRRSNNIYDADVQIVQLATSVKETLQFPQIEQISDSAKNSEAEEIEETTLEDPIDLIREANALQPTVFNNNNDVGTLVYIDNNNKPEDDYRPISTNPFLNNPFLNPPTPVHEIKKLEEIDLLAGCRDHQNKKQQQTNCSVPDVVAMELDVLQEHQHQQQDEKMSLQHHQQEQHQLQQEQKLQQLQQQQLHLQQQLLQHQQLQLQQQQQHLQQQKQQKNEDSNKLVDLDIPEITSTNTNATASMNANTMVANVNVSANVNSGVQPTSACIATKKHQKTLRNQVGRWQNNGASQKNHHRQDNRHRHEVEAGGFDVYNIETAMPKIDLDAIESHLKAAREAERRRRTDREEIRRRLAMGPDAEDARNERGRKPSLQSRLQSGMNLQICFMNDTSSDTESLQDHDGIIAPHPITTTFASTSSSSSSSSASSIATSPTKHAPVQPIQTIPRPQALSIPQLRLDSAFKDGPPVDEADFFARQARLQTEARLALAQAKEMAHMQMEIERQKMKQNPITEMVRSSLQKIGVTLGEDRRRLTRALLTDLNIAQLQVLANDLHARIAQLNEVLVDGLMMRDDLHMEQDSMLVDVEDLTRYLGAKQESFKKRQYQQQKQQQIQSRNVINGKMMQQQSSRALAILRSSSARWQLVQSLVRK